MAVNSTLITFVHLMNVSCIHQSNGFDVTLYNEWDLMHPPSPARNSAPVRIGHDMTMKLNLRNRNLRSRYSPRVCISWKWVFDVLLQTYRCNLVKLYHRSLIFHNRMFHSISGCKVAPRTRPCYNFFHFHAVF